MESQNNVAIFPYGSEFTPIVRYIKNSGEFNIISLISPKGYGIVGKDAGDADGGENIGVIIEEDFSKSIAKCDTLIIADCKPDERLLSKILENTNIAIEQNKNIIWTLSTDEHIVSEFKQKCENKGLSFKHYNQKSDYSYLDIGKRNLEDIDTPVVFVAGLAEDFNKFGIQLSIREGLIEKGYKVSQIGTRDYCEFLGFHSFPKFMYNPGVAGEDKIVLFNRYIKNIELSETPDIIIIGIPGGLMPFNSSLTNGFGLLAFIVSQALSPDYAIVSSFYSEVSAEFFEMLNTSFKYKFGFNVDCFNMSNLNINYDDINQYNKICFNRLDSASVDNTIQKQYSQFKMPVYNILNSSDKLKMTESLLEKLTYYGNRKSIDIGSY